MYSLELRLYILSLHVITILVKHQTQLVLKYQDYQRLQIRVSIFKKKMLQSTGVIWHRSHEVIRLGLITRQKRKRKRKWHPGEYSSLSSDLTKRS